MKLRITIERCLIMFFAWALRTFAPRRYAVRKAIEASARIGSKISDVRGGDGSRKKIAKIVKINNGYRGSKFIKKNKYHGSNS